MSDIISNKLRVFQEKQLEKFLQRGIPTRKEENWKYTLIPQDKVSPSVLFPVAVNDRKNNASILSADLLENSLVFINGLFSESLSHTAHLPEGVTSLSLAMAAQDQALNEFILKEFDAKRYPFAVLNSAQITEGVVLRVAKNVSLTTPIHLLFTPDSTEQISRCPRTVIIVEEGAELTLIEEHHSNLQHQFTNAVTEIYAHRNARVRYHKIQDEGLAATHVSNLFVNQQQDSRVDLFNLTCGAQLSREDVTIKMQSEGAECNMAGLYTLHHDGQHTDHHLHVDHIAKYCTSSMVYKGILDKKSRAVFNGKVHVHPQAKQINAYQANHNLLLSKEAEVNTKPELEIYADDVKCAHGATVGQLNDESLFYLRSRGMDKEAATKILLSAYADEVIRKIENANIKRYIQKRAGGHVEI